LGAVFGDAIYAQKRYACINSRITLYAMPRNNLTRAQLQTNIITLVPGDTQHYYPPD
jgi:hypothetical protein